jgi:hypothetical protein
MGFIYSLKCNITGECYYGKSKKTKEERLRCHNSKGNNCYSKEIILRGDYIFKIEEDFIENEKLSEREYFFITNNLCVNKNIPYINSNNKNERNKIQMNKLYKQDEEFKNKQIKYSNEYYKNNKNLIDEKRKEKILCLCGVHYTLHNNARHKKSIKHQNYLLSNMNI